MFEPSVEFVVTGDNVDAARSVAKLVGGVAYVDDRDVPSLPFRTLVRAVTDRPELLDPAAGIGRYVVCARPKIVRSRSADTAGVVIQINAMVAAARLDHAQADNHWRDIHAPLALVHHAAMSQYTQLSITHTLAGPVYDGFALCEFDSIDDLNERFFNDSQSRKVIMADIAKFAHPQLSPRRLLARRLP